MKIKTPSYKKRWRTEKANNIQKMGTKSKTSGNNTTNKQLLYNYTCTDSPIEYM